MKKYRDDSLKNISEKSSAKHFLNLAALVLTSASLWACAPSTDSFKQNSADTTSSAIIGGDEVSDVDYIAKSTVAIYDAYGGQLCSGSLIANNVVLSAAHCIGQIPKYMIIIFDVNAEAILQNAGSLKALLAHPKVRQVEKAVVSATWKTRQNEDKDTGDVSVLKFTGAAPKGYVPAKMLTDPSALKNGAAVTLAGYGITKGQPQTGTAVLRQVQVSIADTSFSKTEIKIDQTSGHGACHGDSGGPAFIRVAGQDLLWGITSRGVDDAKNDCTRYSAYTNALVYSQVISKAISQLNPSQPKVNNKLSSLN